MARTVYCQEDGCGEEAAYILSSLSGDGTNTLCEGHWIGFVMATAQALADASAALAGQQEPAPEAVETAQEPILGDAEPEAALPSAETVEDTERDEPGA